MHKNYFLFEKQISEIKPLLLGRQVNKVFTFQKNELVLELSEPKSIFIQINISINYPYILTKPIYKIRQTKYDLFNELIGKTIYDIDIRLFDKFITIDINDYKLELLFYSASPNIFLIDYYGHQVNSFKSRTQVENYFESKSMDLREVNKSQFYNKIKALGSESTEKFLKGNFAALNNSLLAEISYRAKIELKENVDQLSDSNFNQLIETIKDLADELNNQYIYIYWINSNIYKLSLIRLFNLEQSEKQIRFEQFETINESWGRFISEVLDSQEYKRLYLQCQDKIDKRLSYLNRTFEQIKKLKDVQKRKAEAQMKGNLLLTFKNQINLDNNEVLLENIFSENRDKIRIRINPRKTLAENAQIYFNKYKDVEKEKLLSTIKESTLLNDLGAVKLLKQELEKSTSLFGLKRLFQKFVDMNLIQTSKKSIPQGKSLAYTFNHFVLENQWDTYVGKSGDNNDLLTFRFANKWDLWLHAQGVSGSHVIIRLPNKNQHPPKKVIEQAAQIAAANSKAKHSTTVPVIYTQVGYVSRIKNAPKGTVKTQNTKTIFVTPLNIN